ncbi:unnamed protein product [Nyctereutes procyonoides]|uniref:(raccoon dog) hypothetical protein n=1 Tax=Nyctereutes procyonoides TaxID=34880 RepID=A0A811ZL50_NYCPR|nr:unnamed protein product [Nyctereutes procyonoides]
MRSGNPHGCAMGWLPELFQLPDWVPSPGSSRHTMCLSSSLMAAPCMDPWTGQPHGQSLWCHHGASLPPAQVGTRVAGARRLEELGAKGAGGTEPHRRRTMRKVKTQLHRRWKSLAHLFWNPGPGQPSGREGQVVRGQWGSPLGSPNCRGTATVLGLLGRSSQAKPPYLGGCRAGAQLAGSPPPPPDSWQQRSTSPRQGELAAALGGVWGGHSRAMSGERVVGVAVQAACTPPAEG